MTPKRPNIRASLILVAIAALVSTVFAGLPAGADPQSDYEAAKSKLAQLEEQSDLLVDAYNAKAEKLAEINKSVRHNEDKLAHLQSNVDAKRGQINNQAVSVYKYGSGRAAAGVESLLNLDTGGDFSRASKYLDEVQGSTRDALNDFAAAQDDLDVQTEKLRGQQAEQQGVVDELKSKQQAIESSIADQERITAQHKERIEAERAAAAARARAAAEAAQRQQAASPSTSSPRRGGSSGGGSSSGGGGGGSARPPSSGAAGAVAWARSQLGKPYCWGGTGPNCYDCSGFTSSAWRIGGGKSIPRTSSAQAGLPRVSSPAPGDLGHRPGHIGMYVGGGTAIHSPRTGDVIKYQSASYYRTWHRP